MSQEQPPIRSRRELRKAREAQQASLPATEQLPPAAGRPAGPAAADKPAQADKPTPDGNSAQADKPTQGGKPAPGGKPAAVDAPVPAVSPAAAARPQAAPHSQSDADQLSTQRSSQIRARDRAALRTIKQLEEKEGQLSAGGPPTRRQLRLQQLKEQALTAANAVVPPADAPTPPQASGTGSGTGTGPGTGTRAGNTTSAPAGTPGGMTVEQALEARALIAAQARNQIAKMEHIASTDPEAVDPEILAEQIALAERAAVMNRRAMARQKLAEQAGAPAGTARTSVPADKPGPSTTNNLAMVTPLEFVQVPGVEHPVMKRPATSHIPVITRPGARVAPGTKAAPGTKGPGTRKPTTRPKPQGQDSAAGRSQVIARAEAAAKAAGRPSQARRADNQPQDQPESQPQGHAEDPFEELPRVAARNAYGLDPLNAATAGLTRARRNRILQFCILAFGILALVAGIILIVSGMSR